MSNQHAVILGGSSGIGLATARHLLGLGFAVTVTGRDRARLEAARSVLGGAGTTLAFDAADTGATRKAFAAIGTFDHLVLALGSRMGAGPFASVDLREVRKGFEEKVYTHFACAQAALPHLTKTGSIVFVSAVSAQAGMPGTAGIGAANAAIEALVPILAAELKPVRVNGVSPGVIDTPWWDFLPPDQKAPAFASFASRTPAGRVGAPDDVARAIGLLVTNGFLTGHTLVCDGGLSLASV
jgi:NAD(P)-dependent dehydrogenase (short-subunit alcohol dehydrogenase family)